MSSVGAPHISEDVPVSTAQLNASSDRKDGLSYAEVASKNVDESPVQEQETHEVKKLITEFETAAKEQKLAGEAVHDKQNVSAGEADANKKKNKKKSASAKRQKRSRFSNALRRCLPCFHREPQPANEVEQLSTAAAAGSEVASLSEEAREQ